MAVGTLQLVSSIEQWELLDEPAEKVVPEKLIWPRWAVDAAGMKHLFKTGYEIRALVSSIWWVFAHTYLLCLVAMHVQFVPATFTLHSYCRHIATCIILTRSPSIAMCTYNTNDEPLQNLLLAAWIAACITCVGFCLPSMDPIARELMLLYFQPTVPAAFMLWLWAVTVRHFEHAQVGRACILPMFLITHSSHTVIQCVLCVCGIDCM